MKFQPGRVYHIYNQGNNRERIFYSKRNYQFFLRKMEKHLLPYADILAFCLMPNHFHWLIYVREEGCLDSTAHQPCSRRALSLAACKAVAAGQDREVLKHLENRIRIPVRQQMLCHKIGQLLSSYTKAINKQEGRSGSLFRKGTNAKDGSEELKKKRNANSLYDLDDHFLNYRRYCLTYIHDNPVKAGLVNHEAEWEFSSADQYTQWNTAGLCNLELADELDLKNVPKEKVDVLAEDTLETGHYRALPPIYA